MSVHWSRVWTLQSGWTNQNAIWGEKFGSSKHCIRWSPDPSTERGTFERICASLRYGTIWYAILTCAQKLTWVSLIYRTNQRLKSRKKKKSTSKKWICSELLVNSPGNPWSQSWRRKRRLRWEGFAEKEGFKPRMKEWGGDGILIIIRINVSSIMTI